jgi:1,4-dihydroxy-2-naphthoate octaprenyltransferase
MTSLLKSIVNESLLGKRGLVKRASQWFILAMYLSYSSSVDLRTGFFLIVLIVIAIECWGISSTLINDLEDKEKDLLAGKRRWVSLLSKRDALLVIAGVIIAGFLAIACTGGGPGVLLAYGSAIITGLLYSIRPFCLKEKGILGLFVYSLTVTLSYALVPWLLLNSSIFMMFVLAVSVFADKWVNLHFHQVVDFSADLIAENNTYAVRNGLEKTRQTLHLASLTASTALTAILIFLLFLEKNNIMRAVISAISISSIMFVGMYVRWLRNSGTKPSDLFEELPWVYLALTYLVFRLLPPVLFISLACKDVLYGIPAMLSFLSLFLESFYSIKYKYE